MMFLHFLKTKKSKAKAILFLILFLQGLCPLKQLKKYGISLNHYERSEAIITALENTNDLSEISLTEPLNAVQAQDQMRLMREDTTTERALAAKHQGAYQD